MGVINKPHKTLFGRSHFAVAIVTLFCGCFQSPSSTPAPAVPVRHVKGDRWPELVGQGASWSELQAAQQNEYRGYLKEQRSNYLWFAHASNGRTGVPFILLRLLPELYPDLFGSPEERFTRFGYAPDAEDPDRPLPLGLGWCALQRPQLNVVTLTCGACHIGQVRMEDGSLNAIVGGPNTRIDVRAWRYAFEAAADRIKCRGYFPTALEIRKLIAAKPDNFFYHNQTSLGQFASDNDERAERQLVSAAAENILESFVERTLAGQLAVAKQKATSYSLPNAPPLDGGSPGQSDGSGDLLPKLLQFDLVLKRCGDSLSRDCSEEALAAFQAAEFKELPQGKATVTDILSTWRQDEHPLAQIDGTVKSPFFRNIAAILAVVGDPRVVNAENADVCARFLTYLPPPAYPFEVDMRRATRGRILFQKNCAFCHRPRNTIAYKPSAAPNEEARFYRRIGTDPNRAQVLNAPAVDLFVRYFRQSVPPGFISTDADGRKSSPGTLPDDSIIIDRSSPENQGYVTDALNGVWARAPYLHNGSVPTLHHLMVPNSRPKQFVRGSISFDRKQVGWCWDPDQRESLRKEDPSAALFRSTWDGASNAGHDRNLTVDREGQILREDWEGPDQAGMYRVRLDWSGQDQKHALGDLLEYLKTL